MYVLKIKRTDVRRNRGIKYILKAIVIVLLLILLFLIGFYVASFFSELLS